MVKQIGFGSAPGKVIISGEHSVVYGQPAIAMALNLRCHATISRSDPGLKISSPQLQIDIQYSPDQLSSLTTGQSVHDHFDGLAKIFVEMEEDEVAYNLDISSEIPISAGLGSSAAVAVATIAAICDLNSQSLDNFKISELAFSSEQVVHGTPSGIDNSIATYGGMLIYEGGKIEFSKLDLDLRFIIVNSRIPRNTKKLVAEVAALDKRNVIVGKLFESMGDLSKEIVQAIYSGDQVRLGELMNINQGLLDAIGVGHSLLSELIWKMRRVGAYGAKLTGAGGGGCMVALMPENISNDVIIKQFESMDVEVIFTKASKQGVIIGSE